MMCKANYLPAMLYYCSCLYLLNFISVLTKWIRQKSYISEMFSDIYGQVLVILNQFSMCIWILFLFFNDNSFLWAERSLLTILKEPMGIRNLTWDSCAQDKNLIQCNWHQNTDIYNIFSLRIWCYVN